MNEEKSQKRRQERDRKNGAVLILSIIVVFFLFSMCGRVSCSGGSDYDDRWDYLQEQVDNDPYYQQWN